MEESALFQSKANITYGPELSFVPSPSKKSLPSHIGSHPWKMLSIHNPLKIHKAWLFAKKKTSF